MPTLVQARPSTAGSVSSSSSLPHRPKSIHDWYDRTFDLPVGSVGADPEDTDDLLKRLHGHFDPDARVSNLRTYATRNRGPVPVKKPVPVGSEQDAAVEIIGKVFEDGLNMQSVQAAERATVRLLRDGMRDYIDYALDEVDRYGSISKTGAVSSFSWRSQANSGDVPSLRRSMGENGVSPHVIEALVLAKPPLRSHSRTSMYTATDKSFGVLAASVSRRRAERLKRPGDDQRFGVI